MNRRIKSRCPLARGKHHRPLRRIRKLVEENGALIIRREPLSVRTKEDYPLKRVKRSRCPYGRRKSRLSWTHIDSSKHLR